MSDKVGYLRVVPRKRDTTRAALLAAGEKLMSTRWAGSVSIDDIIAEAGVSKGSFYNHFIDKETLHQEIVKTVRAALREQILLETKDVDDPARRVARGYCISFRYFLEYPSRIGFLMESLAPHRGPDRIDQGIVGFVSDGIRCGRFLLATVESGVMLMHGLAVAGQIYGIATMDQFAVVARVQQLSALLLRALGLPIAEADQIAAQETDFVIRQYFDGLG